MIILLAALRVDSTVFDIYFAASPLSVCKSVKALFKLTKLIDKESEFSSITERSLLKLGGSV